MGGSRCGPNCGHFGCVWSVARIRGLENVMLLNLGLTPQALRLRLLRRLKTACGIRSQLLLEGRQGLARGLLFLKTKGPVSLHQRVNVAGAFVDDGGLAVTQVTLDGIVV